MEGTFWLQRDRSLTVEVIQNALLNRITIKHDSGNQSVIASHDHHKEEYPVTFSDLKNYAVGLGAEVPAEITRVMLLLLADFFTKCTVPSATPIVSRILEFYDYEVLPQVFTQGVFGSPTAHLLLPVFGSGKVYYQGYNLNAADVHDIFSWQTLIYPEPLSMPIEQIPFLGLESLIYTFIQFKKLVHFTQNVFSDTTLFVAFSENLNNRMLLLEDKIQKVLSFSNDYLVTTKEIAIYLEELILNYGNQLGDNFLTSDVESLKSLQITESFILQVAVLQELLLQLKQENLIIFESIKKNILSGSSENNNWQLMQPYYAFLNFEKLSAIVTLLILEPSKASKFKKTSLATTYRNQVTNVLKEANFAELISKTVTFMYATSEKNNLLV